MTTEEIEKAVEKFAKSLKLIAFENLSGEETPYLLRGAFKEGLESANIQWQEKTRWIPVEERLPEYHGLDSKEYLVKLSVGSISPKISYTTSRLRNEHRWSCETDWRYVTHWKEIE